jgi:hypothetical protein
LLDSLPRQKVRRWTIEMTYFQQAMKMQSYLTSLKPIRSHFFNPPGGGLSVVLARSFKIVDLPARNEPLCKSAIGILA